MGISILLKAIKTEQCSVSFKENVILTLEEKEGYYFAKIEGNNTWLGYGETVTQALEQLLVSIHSTLLLKNFPEEKLTGEARRELSLATELIESFETSDGQ